MGHHHELPLTWVRITSRPLKHDQEVSPRDLWIYVLTTYHIYSNNQIILIRHLNLMPTYEYRINNNSSIFLIHIPCWINNNSSFPNYEYRIVPHANTMSRVILSYPWIFPYLISNPYPTHHIQSMKPTIRVTCPNHIEIIHYKL